MLENLYHFRTLHFDGQAPVKISMMLVNQIKGAQYFHKTLYYCAGVTEHPLIY